NPYRCEPLADEIGHRLKLKLASKQSIHVAAMRCLGQDFERPAMSRTQTLIFRPGGHFDIPHRGGDGPNRSLSGRPHISPFSRISQSVAGPFTPPACLPNAARRRATTGRRGSRLTPEAETRTPVPPDTLPGGTEARMRRVPPHRTARGT